jgi:flagellar assembly factor FliW
MSGQSSDANGNEAAGTGSEADTDREAPSVGPVINFPQGLPGFPTATRFALLPLGDGPSGLLVLQSADDPDLRFLVLPYRGQRLPLRRADVETACAALEVPAEHAAVLLVVTRGTCPGRHDGPGQLYVNLRAPVVLDTRRRLAVQHVLASPGYAVRHPLPVAA